MTVPVALLLVNCVVVGAGLTYLSDLELRAEERFFYGGVLGTVAFTACGIVITRLFTFTGTAVLIAALTALALSGFGWVRAGDRVGHELADLRARLRTPLRSATNPLTSLFLLVPLWVFLVRIFQLAYRTGADGSLSAGHLASWSDWQAHLTYTASFVHSDNTGLNLPLASGYDLNYHGGINYFAALLVRGGASLPESLQVSSGFLAVLFPAVMYLVGIRIFRSQAVAMLGTAVFMFFGGLGWSRFFDDIRDSDAGWGIIWSLPRTYTRDPEQAVLMENPVVGHMFPQRPTLLGFSITLIVIALLWAATQQAGEERDTRPYLFVGVVVGLMPFFNLFGFGTPLALAAVWMLLLRRREWLWFFVPALVLALPVVLYMRPPNSDAADWTYAWVSEVTRNTEPHGGVWGFVRFWWTNTGLFLPLFALSLAWPGALPKRVALASLPVWLWFIIPNFVKPHPWDGNNTHYFVFVLLLGAFPVAALLVHLVRRWTVVMAVPVLAAGFSMMAMGALDIWAAADPQAGNYPVLIADGAGITAGEWVRENTPVDAVLVNATPHTNPVPAMSGRDVLISFDGWVFDLGVTDWWTRRQAALSILQGADTSWALIEQYGVDYVVIGPTELRGDWTANLAYWEQNGDIVYDFGGYRIFEVS